MHLALDFDLRIVYLCDFLKRKTCIFFNYMYFPLVVVILFLALARIESNQRIKLICENDSKVCLFIYTVRNTTLCIASVSSYVNKRMTFLYQIQVGLYYFSFSLMWQLNKLLPFKLVLWEELNSGWNKE